MSERTSSDKHPQPGDVGEKASSLRSDVELFVGLVAIPSLLIYPLGFIKVLLQIYFNGTNIDVATASYATSFIPKAVVTFEGANTFVLSFIVAIVFFSLALRLVLRNQTALVIEELRRKGQFPQQDRLRWEAYKQLLDEAYSRHSKEEIQEVNVTKTTDVGGQRIEAEVLTKDGQTYTIPLWSVLSPKVTVVGFALVVLFLEALLILSGYYVAAALALIAGLLGAKLIGNDFRLYASRLSSEYVEEIVLGEDAKSSWRLISRGMRERWILKGIATIYVLTILGTLASSLTQDVSLPVITIDGRHAGILLSHSDGYWHVVRCSEVEAISNDDAKRVQLSSGENQGSPLGIGQLKEWLN